MQSTQLAPHVVGEVGSASQPLATLLSQFAKPAMQLMMVQAPAEHPTMFTLGRAVQLVPGHELPQLVVADRFTSQPSEMVPLQLVHPPGSQEPMVQLLSLIHI